MPLFSNKFTPKKTPVRKFVSSSFNETERAMNDMTSGDSIVMHLGNTETVFKKGTWSFGNKYYFFGMFYHNFKIPNYIF